MIGNNLYNQFNKFRDHKISFFYKGPLHYDLLYNLGESLKQHIAGSEIKKNRIFSIFIELSENIRRYSAERIAFDHDSNGCGMLQVSESEHAYYLCAGNLINKNDWKNIEKRIKYINDLEREELNNFYNQQRNQAIKKNRDSGNTGLIEIARRSRNPLKIQKYEVDNTFLYFIIDVKLDKT